jgi:hypothetical protein
MMEKTLDSRDLPPGEAPLGLLTLEQDFAEKTRDVYLKEFGEAIRSIPEGATKAEIDVILNRAAQRLTARLETMALRHTADVASLAFRDDGSAFTQVDRYAIEALARRPDAFFSAIRTFPADAVTKLHNIVAASFATRLDLRETVRQMEEEVGGQVYQLERIARSETTRIANAGRELAWRSRPEFDPNEKIYEWIVAFDERLDDDCRVIAAKNPWTLDELKAEISSKGFGEFLVHPNCRCVWVRNPALLLEDSR